MALTVFCSICKKKFAARFVFSVAVMAIWYKELLKIQFSSINSKLLHGRLK